MELGVIEDDFAEPAVDDGAPWNVVLGRVVVVNDPWIIVLFFGKVIVGTKGSVRTLLLGVDAAVVVARAFELGCSGFEFRFEVSDVNVFETLVVESSGGDVLFGMLT